MREKSFDSINVVPFIDIMLILITVVLATATFIKTGVIPVQLPTVAHSESVADRPVVDIFAGGILYYGNGAHSIDQLRGR